MMETNIERVKYIDYNFINQFKKFRFNYLLGWRKLRIKNIKIVLVGSLKITYDKNVNTRTILRLIFILTWNWWSF